MSLILCWRFVAFAEGSALQTRVLSTRFWVVSPRVLHVLGVPAFVDLLRPVFVSFVAFQTFSFEDLGDFGQWIGANIIKKLPFRRFNQPACLSACI